MDQSAHTAKWLQVGIGLLVVSALSVHAAGYRNPTAGAAAMGRAGMRLTHGEDATVVMHNPANMTDLTRSQAMGSATFAFSETTYTSPLGASETSDSPWHVLPAVFAVWPLEDNPWALGLSVHSPYGQSKEWDEEGVFKGLAPYFAEMTAINVQPTAAYRISDSLSVGAGLDVLWGDLEFRMLLPWMPGPAGLAGPSSRLSFKGDGYAIGGNIGATWHVTENQRVAVTYRTPMTLNTDGDFSLANPPPPDALPPIFTTSSSFDTEIKFPAVLVIGYGAYLTEDLRVEANVEWVEHSRNDTMELDIGNNNALLTAVMGSSKIPQDWDDTWTVGVGFDWRFADEWVLRGGWTHFPSPIPDETIMPVLAEDDQDVFAVGLGFQGGTHVLDVAYAYNRSDDRTIDPGVNPVAGTYEFDAHLVAVTYGYSF